MGSFEGDFYVRRVSGILPPFGVTKRIAGGQGCTYLFRIPVGRFRVVGRRFVYRWWPIVDEIDRGAITLAGDGDRTILGRGRLFGFLTFCRFRLEPMNKGRS
jgi:hypothetical protein